MNIENIQEIFDKGLEMDVILEVHELMEMVMTGMTENDMIAAIEERAGE